MKLLVRDDRYEGQIYRNDALIVVGKWVEHTGWYILVNLRMIQKHVDAYVDVNTWESRPARCYLRGYLGLRRSSNTGKWFFTRQSIWAEL